MRSSRIRRSGVTCQHIYNRAGGTRKDIVFGDKEKEMFFELVHELTKFFTVEVVSLVCMGNHWHAVICSSDELPSREEAARRYEAYYGGSKPTPIWSVDAEYLRHAGRMADFSCFVKDLQQKFTTWFNKTRPVRRRGRLWADRFKNVILEDGPALWQCVEYVEMNPVRAGLCGNPGDYAFSTWGRWKTNGVHPFAENVVKHMGDVLGKPDEIPIIDDVLRELENRVEYATRLELGATGEAAQKNLPRDPRQKQARPDPPRSLLDQRRHHRLRRIRSKRRRRGLRRRSSREKTPDQNRRRLRRRPAQLPASTKRRLTLGGLPKKSTRLTVWSTKPRPSTPKNTHYSQFIEPFPRRIRKDFVKRVQYVRKTAFLVMFFANKSFKNNQF